MPEVYGLDAYAADAIVARVNDVGVRKARLTLLAQLAGAFAGLGALMSTLEASDDMPGFATSRLLRGLVFPHERRGHGAVRRSDPLGGGCSLNFTDVIEAHSD